MIADGTRDKDRWWNPIMPTWIKDWEYFALFAMVFLLGGSAGALVAAGHFDRTYEDRWQTWAQSYELGLARRGVERMRGTDRIRYVLGTEANVYCVSTEGWE